MKAATAACVLWALALVSFPGSAAPADDATKAAVSAATTWLSLIDDGRYADSWTEASTFFRTSITQAKWAAALDAARRPLGQRMSRSLVRASETTTLPGAPAGRYVVMQFDASFAGRKSAAETVTFLLDRDGKWRSAGYFIR